MDNAGDAGAMSAHVFARARFQMDGVAVRDEGQIIDEFHSSEAGAGDFDSPVQDGHSNPFSSSLRESGSRLFQRNPGFQIRPSVMAITDNHRNELQIEETRQNRSGSTDLIHRIH